MTAQGTPIKPVQTILVAAREAASIPRLQAKLARKSVRRAVEPDRHHRPEADIRRILNGECTTKAELMAKGAEFTASADTLDAFLLPHSQTSAVQERMRSGTTRSHGGRGERGHPTAEAARGGSEPCLYGCRRQVRPDGRTA